MFKKKNKVTLRSVIEEVAPILIDKTLNRLHIYIDIYTGNKLDPLLDQERVLNNGSRLQFIEYYTDEEALIHRREFEYVV